jgi:hypothetical protein
VIDATNKLRNRNITWEQASDMLKLAQKQISSKWMTYDSTNNKEGGRIF